MRRVYSKGHSRLEVEMGDLALPQTLETRVRELEVAAPQDAVSAKVLR